MRILLCLIIITLCFWSCKEKAKRPSWINFEFSDDSTHVFGSNKRVYPFQVYFKQNGNIVSDTIVLRANSSVKLLSFKTQDMDTLSILKSYEFKGAFGDPTDTIYDSTFNYQLPFPKYKSYKVLQGNNTNFTHSDAFSRYAIDFRMPVGDTICAARSGYVVGIVENFNKNGNDESYREYANFITMYHEDGTFSQYVHLKQNGALVSLNEYVEQGQPIALSGNTGWSTEPHLHFAVFRSVPLNFESIPIIINGNRSQTIKKWDVASHDIQKDHP
ncbi:M23 family metallopeptidase [uncultured Psychroserpens sp.]|uniref:M23 family metallopeptidase n=1 Tax=uncultured Psychroserpens sp. TaxID=255436 RepID=UPI002619223E|nr:M23 family metallopeptidase [uncultured Psychroserpens sp.]